MFVSMIGTFVAVQQQADAGTRANPDNVSRRWRGNRWWTRLLDDAWRRRG